MVHFSKSYPEPECLAFERAKTSGNYNCPGVFTQLGSDFEDKCYLCEKKGGSDFITEHFREHRGDHTLKFAWDNLFHACNHCNNTKQAVAMGRSILDCTKGDQKVDQWLSYRMPMFPKESPVSVAVMEDTEVVRNTATLLEVIYNGHTTENKMQNAKGLRSMLSRELANFWDLLNRYHRTRSSDPRKAELRKSIISQLQNTSAFTAFKRWIIRDIEVLRAEFGSAL